MGLSWELNEETKQFAERIAAANPMWFQFLKDSCKKGDGKLVKSFVFSALRNISNIVGTSAEGINPFCLKKAINSGVLDNTERDVAAERSFELYRLRVIRTIQKEFTTYLRS